MYPPTHQQTRQPFLPKRAHSHHPTQPAQVANIIARHPLQAKLKVGAPNDHFEREADRVADRVMRMPDPAAARSSVDGVHSAVTLQRKCSACEDEALQRKPVGSHHETHGTGLDSVASTPRQGGRPLDAGTRNYFEPRFGGDFSDVRIHTSSDAAELNHKLGARAFTLGSDIFFSKGEYRPDSKSGRHLIAHELVHARQSSPNTIRRCVNPTVNNPKYDAFATRLKSHAAYAALADKTNADGVLVEAKKKGACIYMLDQFQKLLDTPEKNAVTITTETNAATAIAVTTEKSRVAAAPPANLTIEETASKDPGRVWVKIAGKFGGGKYEVDRTNPKNIVVRAKIFLKVAGTGTQADVNNVKAMEDGIEKAASAKGFIVDIDFVSAAGGDAFEVEVNPGEWETATNWSGGEPLGFAHELFHLLYYEVDRYNYIDAHATNQSMMVPDRIYWFLTQLKKPSGWDNPASIAASGPHPLDDDVCRVAGLPEADCIKARKKP